MIKLFINLKRKKKAVECIWQKFSDENANFYDRFNKA